MATREEWGTRIGFVLSAIGSAIGLGNIWRFPYMAYSNGGGAFLIPYFFALLTAGIPIIILEFSMGHRYRGSAPLSFFRILRKWEWLGWWQSLVCFVIAVYYIVVISWALNYTIYSLSLKWGDDPNMFFMKNFLNTSKNFWHMGTIQLPILIGGGILWTLVWLVLFSGVRRGIEIANKIFMPILFIMILIMLVRAVSLEGAKNGLNWLFKPDFSIMFKYKVWAAAYGQIFFSLSICFAIMITYASYLPARSDLANNGAITAFINCGFSMLAGIVIFSILGYMAAQQGVPVKKVVSSGVGLAFITLPKAINLLPFPQFFGFLFFLSLVFAGFTSMISISEACCSAFIDKYGWDRRRVVSIFSIIGSLFSLIFMTRSGIFILDIVDHFINNFGIIFAGLIEVILISWLFDLESLRSHVNEVSDFRIGKWWNFCLKVITPIVLGYMGIANLIGDIKENYSGYDSGAIFIFGWMVLIIIIVLSFVLQYTKSNWPKLYLLQKK